MASSHDLSRFGEADRQRREHERRRVLLSAQLHTSTTMYRVRIRDVSGWGARIEGEHLPPLGVIVCLQRGGRAAYGVMAWVNGESGGIQFDEPVDEDHFGREQPLPHRGAPEPYRRPGFGRRGEAPLYSTGDGWVDPAALPLRR